MARITIGGSGAEGLELAFELARILEQHGAIEVDVVQLSHGGAAYTLDVSRRTLRALRDAADHRAALTAA